MRKCENQKSAIPFPIPRQTDWCKELTGVAVTVAGWAGCCGGGVEPTLGGYGTPTHNHGPVSSHNTAASNAPPAAEPRPGGAICPRRRSGGEPENGPQRDTRVPQIQDILRRATSLLQVDCSRYFTSCQESIECAVAELCCLGTSLEFENFQVCGAFDSFRFPQYCPLCSYKSGPDRELVRIHDFG